MAGDFTGRSSCFSFYLLSYILEHERARHATVNTRLALSPEQRRMILVNSWASSGLDYLQAWVLHIIKAH